jgi:hypothetical protein
MYLFLDSLDQHKAIILLRKMLMDVDPTLIQQVIDKNLVYILIKFIQVNQHPHLTQEAAWCIANLTNGSKHQIQSLIDRGLFDVLKLILDSPHTGIFEQGAWIIGNISADADIFRK